MKKSLLALAALAAAGAASAQSSVTLYGIADISGGYKETNVNIGGPTKFVNGKTKTTGANVANLGDSRIGLKGSEDLGNGLKAVFNYEWQMDGAHGAINSGSKGYNNWSNGAAREAFVGLEGGFGQVRVGTTDSPVRNLAIAGTADAASDFDTTNLPALVNRVSGIHYFGNFSGVGVQAFAGYSKDSSDAYKTTTFDPATGSATGSEVVDGGTTYKGYGLGLSYANGPLLVGAAVQQFKNSGTTTTTSFDANGQQIGNPSVADAQGKKTEAVVGGAYDFGVAKLFANYVYGKVSDKGNAYVADMAGTDFSGFQKVQEFNLGVTVPYGAASFVAEYGYNRYNVAANNEKATGNDFMVGANYAFSKRTDVYVRAAQLNDLKNGDDKNWTRVYAAGIRHKF